MNTDNFKKRLLEEKESLEHELERIGRRNPHNTADFEATPGETGKAADEGDQAEILESYAENTALVHELELRHTDVLDALAKIDAGTYGVCEVSEEPIEAERLEADPAARTCKSHL